MDEMEKCGHYRHWHTDFDLVEEIGISCQADRNMALRENNGHADACGLYDLDRRILPMGKAYCR